MASILLVIAPSGGSGLVGEDQVRVLIACGRRRKSRVAALPHCVKPCGEISALGLLFLGASFGQQRFQLFDSTLEFVHLTGFRLGFGGRRGLLSPRLRAAGCSVSGRRLGPASLQ